MRRNCPKIKIISSLVVFMALFGLAAPVIGQTLPKVSIQVGESDDASDLTTTLKILVGLTVLSLAPSIIIMVTSFVRIVVIFSFLRHAMGTHQMPPNQLMVGLALILTFFLMAPAIEQVNTNSIQPYLAGDINQKQAYESGIQPIREFMLHQVREKDLELFVNLSKIETPQSPEDIPTYVLIPGFIISELRIAFQIGFTLFIPFLIIDMVVASVLMSMGMLMLPPIMVSLPFKILLFVLVDGWYLIIKSVISSFG
ncbi:MAG: flagellar type III secretion system pore protein FliP [candidate division Zixibacteria bacterium]|nr:flagellar type III secretion system pore protein FliP [candidate division Zixibacteria bacterium]